MSTIMEKEIFEQGRAVKDCLNYNMSTLNALTDIIGGKKYCGIVLAARGSSDNAGTYFKYAVENLTGLPVSLAAPSTNTLYGGVLKLNNYIVIGVSQSGAAEDVMAVLANAKEQKALTIAITNNLDSKMAKMADYHLYCACGDELSVAATKTFLTQMYLLANLAAKIGKNESIIKGLEELSENIEKVLTLNEKVKTVANKYKDATMMIVLARGLNLAIAQETSLKLQETCYLNARPYAASDFVHGPFALIDEKTNVILLAPSGETMPDMMNIKNRLLSVGAKVIIYTDSEEAAAGCTDKIIIPVKCNDYFSPFYNVIISQMLACNLSAARGLNPDAPRGLKKVTITK